MLTVDVNVLVSAYRDDAPDHAEMAHWLVATIDDGELIGAGAAVIVGTVRILTHPRVFSPPSPITDAWDRMGELLAHPRSRFCVPGSDTADRRRPVPAYEPRGTWSATPSAAVAIEHDATSISKDRDFARFPGLRWRHPLDPIALRFDPNC